MIGLNEVTGLNEELDLMKAVTSTHGEQIARLAAKINYPNGALMSITRAETSFKFKLHHVARRFFRDVKSQKRSDKFWCRGVQWSIEVRRILINRFNYLGVYLTCHNKGQLKWSCEVNFKLILFTHLPETQNLTRDFVHTYTKPESFGDQYFIRYPELIKKKNGYIKDDQIVLRIEMRAGPIVEESSSDSRSA